MSTRDTADALRRDQDGWLAPLLDQLQAAERDQTWDRVEALCKQILQRDGENWAIWQRLALSFESRSDWNQAETLWRHLTQRFSQRPEPYLALAALQRQRGAPDAARVVLQQAERRLGSLGGPGCGAGVAGRRGHFRRCGRAPAGPGAFRSRSPCRG